MENMLTTWCDASLLERRRMPACRCLRRRFMASRSRWHGSCMYCPRRDWQHFGAAHVHLVSRHLSNGLPPFTHSRCRSTMWIDDCPIHRGGPGIGKQDSLSPRLGRLDSYLRGCRGPRQHGHVYAARKFAEVVDNVYRIIAIELICAAQGIELRKPALPSPANQKLLAEVAACPADDRSPYWPGH